MLAIEIEFLTGRYVATAFDDRSHAEWPPHPARFFSALVAAHFEALDPSPNERSVLEWLEGLGPPEISASEAREREAVTVFVPVNDTSVVGSLDDEADAVSKAGTALEAAQAKGAKAVTAATKQLAKAEARFQQAIAKAIAAVPPGKEGKSGPSLAESILPDRRTRQPRTFPSVTPDIPRITFAWPTTKASVAERRILDSLVSRVVRLGHSSSFVSMRVANDCPAPAWVPDETGEVVAPERERILRVFSKGQTQSLVDAFARQADAPGRVIPAAFQRYLRPSPKSDVAFGTTVFGATDWIVLRRVDGQGLLGRLPSVRGVEMARSLRKALMSAYGSNVPEILSGHAPSGEPTARAHVAYVPLPYVGSAYADGSVMGVALIFPRDASRDERRAVYRALGSWEKAQRESNEETPVLPIHLGKTGVVGVTRLEFDAAEAKTLQPVTWCRASKMWASASPVALDRNPGELRSKDPRKEASAFAEAESTIATACERIGLPRPHSVSVVVAAPLAGSEKVRHFPLYRAGKPPIERVLAHAILRFDAPVEGPILLGAGRYFGLGLFRPVFDHE